MKYFEESFNELNDEMEKLQKKKSSVNSSIKARHEELQKAISSLTRTSNVLSRDNEENESSPIHINQTRNEIDVLIEQTSNELDDLLRELL